MQLNKVPTPYLPNYAPEISVTPLIGEKTAPSSDDFSLLEPLVRSDTWARSSQTIPADNMRIAETEVLAIRPPIRWGVIDNDLSRACCD